MTNRNLALLLLIPFSLLSAYAVYQAGYLGIFRHQFVNAAGWQVLADLVVACVLLMAWMIRDAKNNNRNPWPFLVLTLFLGSFGPLLYMLTSKPSARQAHA